MTSLPTRHDEAWRYSDLAALAEVWPGRAAATHARSVAVAANRSEHLVDRLSEPGFSNEEVEIHLADGATLDHVVVQDSPEDAIVTAAYKVHVAANARYRLVVVNMGSRFGRIAPEIEITGEGACVDLSAMQLGHDRQTLEIVSVIRHSAPNAVSHQKVRSVMTDRAAGSYLGKIRVDRGADGTDAEQSSRNLLLERTATVNTKPELEIYADDVKCAHGATVGELDANALFYLMSRGIPEGEAKTLLIRAFVGDVLEDIRDSALRDEISARAARWLDGATA